TVADVAQAAVLRRRGGPDRRPRPRLADGRGVLPAHAVPAAVLGRLLPGGLDVRPDLLRAADADGLDLRRQAAGVRVVVRRERLRPDRAGGAPEDGRAVRE